jgi:hypothetical protein
MLNDQENACKPTIPPRPISTRRGLGHWGRRGLRAVFFLVALSVTVPAWAGANFDLISAPAGITLARAGNNYNSSFGNLNALGVGPATAGATIIPLANGALYYTPYQLWVHGGLPAGQTGYVTAYVSSNFAHPAALILESCPSTSSCNTAAQFAPMSTNSGAQTTVVPPPGIAKGVTVTAGLAIFVPDVNGAGAWSGSDSATITFAMYNYNTGALIETLQLALNNPNEQLQTALQLNLTTAAGGLAITPAADFALNFGNVNALGIGATVPTVTCAGGIAYTTPYVLQPAFTDMTSTTGTISVYVGTDFVHPAVLTLMDSAAAAGPYSNISKTAAAPTVITTAAASRSSMTRDLGLCVAAVNGPSAFTGADSATLTFTLTVP